MFETNSENGDRDNGFRMTFDNDFAVSVQWHNKAYAFVSEQYPNLAFTAECAVFDNEGRMIEWSNGDTVEGNLSADKVATLLANVKAANRLTPQTCHHILQVDCDTMEIVVHELVGSPRVENAT